MAYTGRDDLSQAIERIRTGVVDKLILPEWVFSPLDSAVGLFSCEDYLDIVSVVNTWVVAAKL